MIEVVRTALASQLSAGLMMVEKCVEQCEPANWESAVGRFPFWQVAYHVLFVTDLYLSEGEKAFKPPEFHREDYQFFGKQPWPPFKPVVTDRPYDKSTLAEYAQACRKKVADALAKETEQSLGGESGFDWLPMTRLEAHLYNIRHIQHHAGQLSAMLGRVQGKGAGWVGMEKPE